MLVLERGGVVVVGGWGGGNHVLWMNSSCVSVYVKCVGLCVCACLHVSV